MTARELLLGRVMEVVAARGLGDRSLREIAADAGSSHRMLLYHFGSRAGLVAAIVTAMEEQQRRALLEIAETARTPADVTRELWHRLSADDAMPFVRLFFETVALSATGQVPDLTTPWLDASARVARDWGIAFDEAEARLGVAVVRGLLLDLLAGASVAPATEALERHLARLPPGEPVPGP